MKTQIPFEWYFEKPIIQFWHKEDTPSEKKEVSGNQCFNSQFRKIEHFKVRKNLKLAILMKQEKEGVCCI